MNNKEIKIANTLIDRIVTKHLIVNNGLSFSIFSNDDLTYSMFDNYDLDGPVINNYDLTLYVQKELTLDKYIVLYNNYVVESSRKYLSLNLSNVYSKIILTNKPCTEIKAFDSISVQEQKKIMGYVYDKTVKNFQQVELSNKEKLQLLVNGRTIQDIPRNIAIKYMDLENMLSIEKKVMYMYTFKAEQIERIYADPINLVYILANKCKVEIIDNVLMGYNPDYFYSGKPFCELIDDLKIECETVYSIKYTYDIDNLIHLLEGNNLLQTRYAYGILKVMIWNDILSIDDLLKIFNTVSNTSIYKYSLLNLIVKLESKKFGLDIKICNSERKLYRIVSNEQKDQRIKHVNISEKIYNTINSNIKLNVNVNRLYTEEKVKYDKLISDVAVIQEKVDEYFNITNTLGNEILEHEMNNNSTSIEEQKDADLKQVEVDRIEKLNDILMKEVDEYDVKINEVKKVYVKHLDLMIKLKHENITLLTKTAGSNLLALYIKTEDYDSVNALLNSGIPINSLFYNSNILQRSIFAATSFKMLRYLHMKGAELYNSRDEINIFSILLTFKDVDVIPSILLLVLNGCVNNVEQLTAVVDIIKKRLK